MATAKAQKDFTELVVEPFSDPDPKPLAGLLPARALADADSKFVTVTVRGEAVVVHYKESSPPPESQSQSRSPSPRDIDAVVCLHGANGSEFSFRNLLPRLASDAGVRAIAFDRPPYGLSSRPKLKKNGDAATDAATDAAGATATATATAAAHFVYTPEGQAELTLALMDALGVTRACVLGHSAGAPVALDAALRAPERIPTLALVAPAIFVGGDPLAGVPLDRALRFAWFRFLISQDGPGLNLVRGSVRRQLAAIEEGRTYANLSEDVRRAYARPTKAEGWDEGLLQSFRAGSFADASERLRREVPNALAPAKTKVVVVVGKNDRTTPPALSEALRDVLIECGVEDVRYELMPTASHLPMEEEAGGVRETFEALVVDVVLGGGGDGGVTTTTEKEEEEEEVTPAR